MELPLVVSTYPNTSIFHRKPEKTYCKKLPSMYHEENVFAQSSRKLIWFSLAYCWQVQYAKTKMMFMEMFEGNYVSASEAIYSVKNK